MEDSGRPQVPFHKHQTRRPNPIDPDAHANQVLPPRRQQSAREADHSPALPLHRRQRLHRPAQPEPQANVSLAVLERERHLLQSVREAQASHQHQERQL